MRILPPEAYTNRELAQAYAWLQTQPEHVQRLGTSRDAIISLYKRAVRGGDANFDNANSAEMFRADLKNLADGLKNFEPATTIASASTVSQTYVGHPVSPSSTQQHYSAPAAPTVSAAKSEFELDEKSWKMIQMVKSELNLGHEVEAIRLLIKLGFEKVAPVLPSASI